MNIRRAIESDFAAMWPIFQAVIASGTTYVFAADTSYEDGFAYWFAPGVASYVAEDAGRIVSMYKLVANQRDLGSHVANASFMVDPTYSGKGAGREMGQHCLCEAKKGRLPSDAVQFRCQHKQGGCITVAKAWLRHRWHIAKGVLAQERGIC
jgi:GNAT superfamily N-acetyltransferase